MLIMRIVITETPAIFRDHPPVCTSFQVSMNYVLGNLDKVNMKCSVYSVIIL